jgi:hypothetical protein
MASFEAPRIICYRGAATRRIIYARHRYLTVLFIAWRRSLTMRWLICSFFRIRISGNSNEVRKALFFSNKIRTDKELNHKINLVKNVPYHAVSFIIQLSFPQSLFLCSLALLAAGIRVKLDKAYKPHLTLFKVSPIERSLILLININRK